MAVGQAPEKSPSHGHAHEAPMAQTFPGGSAQSIGTRMEFLWGFIPSCYITLMTKTVHGLIKDQLLRSAKQDCFSGCYSSRGSAWTIWDNVKQLLQSLQHWADWRFLCLLAHWFLHLIEGRHLLFLLTSSQTSCHKRCHWKLCYAEGFLGYWLWVSCTYSLWCCTVYQCWGEIFASQIF